MGNDAILVIENDPNLFNAIHRALRQAIGPVEMDWVANVRDAKELMEKKAFRAVISDVLLDGDRTGLDFWRECRHRSPSLPFILMSALPVSHFVEWMDGETTPPPFVPKPFDIAELARLLRERL